LPHDACSYLDMIDFCRMGGFLLLYITGAGKYSIDAWCAVVAP
jgi:uncharacterized membrane protein YphA (DoxX/SURF4 family)